MQKFTAIGHVGKDPEITDLRDGMKVAKFSLATTKRGYTTKAGKVVEDKTSWHSLVLWNKLAEVAEKHIKKGSKLYIEGEIVYGKYEKDNITRYTTDIEVERIEFLDSKKSEKEHPQMQEAIEQGDDLPF